jgi:hypothetical protein
MYLKSIGARRFVAPLPFRGRTLYLKSIGARRFVGDSTSQKVELTVPGEHWRTSLCGASTGQKVELYLESIGARRFVAPLPARRRNTVPGEHWRTSLCCASTGQKVELYLL